jgi:hypothetical protein
VSAVSAAVTALFAAVRAFFAAVRSRSSPARTPRWVAILACAASTPPSSPEARPRGRDERLLVCDGLVGVRESRLQPGHCVAQAGQLALLGGDGSVGVLDRVLQRRQLALQTLELRVGGAVALVAAAKAGVGGGLGVLKPDQHDLLIGDLLLGSGDVADQPRHQCLQEGDDLDLVGDGLVGGGRGGPQRRELSLQGGDFVLLASDRVVGGGHSAGQRRQLGLQSGQLSLLGVHGGVGGGQRRLQRRGLQLQRGALPCFVTSWALSVVTWLCNVVRSPCRPEIWVCLSVICAVTVVSSAW